MFKKLNDDELQEWLEKQMEKENRSLENNFFSRIVGKQDDITDEELDRLYEDAVKRLEMQEELQKKEEKKEHLRKEKWKKRFSFKGDSAVGYRKLSKVAGFVIVCAISVFAASMTIEANRNYFVIICTKILETRAVKSGWRMCTRDTGSGSGTAS